MEEKAPEKKENNLWFAYDEDLDAVIESVSGGKQSKGVNDPNSIIKHYCSSGLGINGVKYADLLEKGVEFTLDEYFVGEVVNPKREFKPVSKKYRGMLKNSN